MKRRDEDYLDIGSAKNTSPVGYPQQCVGGKKEMRMLAGDKLFKKYESSIGSAVIFLKLRCRNDLCIYLSGHALIQLI